MIEVIDNFPIFLNYTEKYLKSISTPSSQQNKD